MTHNVLAIELPMHRYQLIMFTNESLANTSNGFGALVLKLCHCARKSGSKSFGPNGGQRLYPEGRAQQWVSWANSAWWFEKKEYRGL